ncbi:MAG TPA: hypothetical protein VGT05_05210 [Patescibacteria group bacterium]|nr:hypothetical protein [Patescibacteria group bacterium]
MRLIKHFFSSFIALFIISGILTSQALATGFYTAGNTGYDTSYPQGSNSASYPATPFNFGVVGVTSGRAFDDNPYLSQQFAWAQQGNTTPPSLYMNLNAPVGLTVKGNTSTPTQCSNKDKICQAKNYGYNAAKHSYEYALSLTPSVTSSMWWLDIETGNNWSSNKSINAAAIEGALSFFTEHGIQAGVYSNTSSWDTIVGNNFIQAVPNWLAGNNSNPSGLCQSPFSINGSVYLVQYASGSFDADYACN